METDKDHIHYMIETEPTMSVSKIVNLMKSYTAYHIWESHPNYLQKYFWKEHTFWTGGYFACSVGRCFGNKGSQKKCCVNLQKIKDRRQWKKMLKTYKYRIYPNKIQQEQIAKTFDCCRFVYNQTLAYRKDAYEKEKKSNSIT